jgi:hypothetical protein
LTRTLAQAGRSPSTIAASVLALLVTMVLVDACPDCAGLCLDRDEIQSLEVFFERMRREEQEAAKRDFLSGLRRLFGG